MNKKPNKKLRKALKETEKIINDKNRKGYKTIKELFEALEDNKNYIKNKDDQSKYHLIYLSL